jgi:hypothetical protein
MAVEDHQSDWLPKPPPPRPARRDAAIDAALRKFDGIEEAAPAAARPSWASTHRPQLAVAFSAMLLVVVGIPAALIGLRNQPAPSNQPQSAIVTEEAVPPSIAFNERPRAPTPSNPPPAPVPPTAPSAPPPPQTKVAPVAPAAPQMQAPRETEARQVADLAPVVAAAPPPPPPPPSPAPAAPAQRSEEKTAQAMTGNLITTGTRVPDSALSGTRNFEAKSISGQPYAAFLSRLQSAVRSNDRKALIALVQFPLRVNFPGGARQYRDARAVQRDFDRIFTPKVRRAVISQRAEQLFVRDQGAMVGSGELWFRESCANADCSRLGPVRIVAVNP